MGQGLHLRCTRSTDPFLNHSRLFKTFACLHEQASQYLLLKTCRIVTIVPHLQHAHFSSIAKQNTRPLYVNQLVLSWNAFADPYNSHLRPTIPAKARKPAAKLAFSLFEPLRSSATDVCCIGATYLFERDPPLWKIVCFLRQQNLAILSSFHFLLPLNSQLWQRKEWTTTTTDGDMTIASKIGLGRRRAASKPFFFFSALLFPFLLLSFL
jgi:hypothetical protein